MKRNMLILFLCLMGLSPSVAARDNSTCSGLTLMQTTSVRAQGMGGVQTAVATDEAGSIGWNPAALHFDRSVDLSAAYFRGLSDDSFGSLDFNMGVNENVAWGGGLLIYDAGNFELTTNDGITTSVRAQRDIQASVTAAYRSSFLGLSPVLGTNIKFLQSTLLEQYSSFAMAVDFGVYLPLPGMLNAVKAGLAVKNLGTPLRYVDAEDPLPACALFGLAYDLYQSEGIQLTLAGDAQYDWENRIVGSVGTEALVTDNVALRVGYKIADDLASITMGAGFHYQNFRIDYAFGPSRALNSTHLASIKYTFAASAQPVVQAPATKETENEDDLTENALPKPDVPSEKMRTEVLEVRKTGGRPSVVIMRGGTEQNIRVGFQGILVDSADRPLAAFVIRQVDTNLSLADIIGLSRDLNADVIAIIEKPLPTVEQPGNSIQ